MVISKLSATLFVSPLTTFVSFLIVIVSFNNFSVTFKIFQFKNNKRTVNTDKDIEKITNCSNVSTDSYAFGSRLVCACFLASLDEVSKSSIILANCKDSLKSSSKRA